MQTATPQNSTPPATPRAGGDENLKATPQLQAPILAKASSRGPSGKSTLETVQENSVDDIKEPSPAAVKAAADLKPLTKISDDDKQATKAESNSVEVEKHTQQGESGSESAGTKVEKKKDQSTTQQRPKNSNSKSYASITSTKSRQPEGKQNMTVETETVASIPQSALSAGDRTNGGRNDNSGSVKLKPSIETIRPKKERKKTSQKARSVNQSTGMFYSPTSPLLISQELFEADESDGNGFRGSSRSSSTAREQSTNSEPGSPQPIPRRHLSYTERFKRTFSLRRPAIYSRTFSNKYVRKASSKADIFEARVANAVDEANSSESDETFVYESNPPEPQRRARHHSRTPSVTSSHSVADQQRGTGMRSFGDALDDRRVAGKRSMKFSNNPYNDMDSPESKDGSVRSHQPRHFGRFGRGGSHTSMLEQQDSPFTQASKLRSGHRNSRPNSPRDSPRSYQQQRSIGLFAGKKQEPSFDMDADGADDERTPLFGTVRTPRSGRLPRRINSSSGHSIDEYYGVRRHSRCGRVGGCVLGLVVFAAVILSALAFLVMSNRPMYDVKIKKIQNVLASEQELILDLMVGAVNPNALGITVSDMNIDIFAKSEHVGSGSLSLDQDGMPLTTSASRPNRRRRRALPSSQLPTLEPPLKHWQDLSSHWHAPRGGVDEGTDPPDDDDLEKDAQTMLLGRIFHFDQALTFEGSPIKRHRHYSVGELRLEKPGNKTETGGSARWEKVLQYPFELIIRGVLKYQLPISSRMQNAAVSASVIVHPEEGVNKFGNMRLEKVDKSEKWQWVEWEDLEDDLDEGRVVEEAEEGETG